MAKLIHTMIRVADESRSIDFYKKAFNLSISDRFEFDTFVLTYLRNEENDVELELTVNKGQEEPYSHGSGYGHIAVAVDNLQAEHQRLKESGLEPDDMMSLDFENKKLASFFFITDPDGYQIEVLQSDGRYR